jgi:hypothetical protein
VKVVGQSKTEVIANPYAELVKRAKASNRIGPKRRSGNTRTPGTQ